MPTNYIQMRNRIRTKVRVGELGSFIEQRQNEVKQKFGKLMEIIMQENKCSWEEAKTIYKKTKVERAIARELKSI